MYSSAIQLEITRPLDPKNLKANLRFLEERRYNDIIRALNEDTCIVQHENGEVTHVRSRSFLYKLSTRLGLGSFNKRCFDFSQKTEFRRVISSEYAKSFIGAGDFGGVL